MSPLAGTADPDLLHALSRAVDGHARPGGDADAVAGVRAGWVVEPADTQQVAAALRIAAQQGLTVVARGTGSRMTWGAPPRSVGLVVDLSRMNRVLEHAAGDLVMRAQAGARLMDVQSALAKENQQLAIDPAVPPGAADRGTLGGVIATGASGPLRLSHGAVRDLLIGVTMVRADGTIAHAGGKVVKNVAGYDLGKLLTGSWGTLAVITEATFRLHPVSPCTRWVMLGCVGPDRAHTLVQRTVHSQLVPTAVELDRNTSGDTTVAVQVSGTEQGVPARVGALLELLDVRSAEVLAQPPSWWPQLPWPVGGVGLRLTHELTGLGKLIRALDEACAEAGCAAAAVRGSAGVGLLHAGLVAEPAQVAVVVDRLRQLSARWGGDVVVLDAPIEVRACVDSWGPVRGLPLMQRIKDQFDPERRLAPGRFVGGI